MVESGDLVEEERTRMGHLDQAGLRRFGTSKRAFLVSEQLGLDQVLRDRGAIQTNERVILAVAGLHDSLRHQFLARSTFAPYENCGVAVRDRLDCLVYLLHGRTAPNHSTERGLVFNMLS